MGFVCHDLVFEVNHQESDEKTTASALLNCGGGTASNAAVTAARLGFHTDFIGYIGTDVYDDLHMSEFRNEGVNAEWVVRDAKSTPFSAILVKPDGQRTIINYRGNGEGRCSGCFDLTQLKTKSILIDGHQFELAQELVDYAKVMSNSNRDRCRLFMLGDRAINAKCRYML